jgi:hypothetical protein
MGQRYYVLDAEFKQAVQQVVRQFMNSWYPGVLGKRRAVPSGGPGGVDIRLVKVADDIAAATTDEEGNVTPGTGEGTLFEFGSMLGDESALTEETIDLENYGSTLAEGGSKVFAFERASEIWVILEAAGDLTCELAVEEGSLVVRLMRGEDVVSECSWPGYICGEE